MFMKKLKHTNQEVEIAIGKEGKTWYVQTTDLNPETFYSESIKKEIKTEKKAIKIAKKYAKKYKMNIQCWNGVDMSAKNN